jgi:enoyl-CoA hydratase
MEARPTVEVTRTDPGVAVVTLNRPERRNAITRETVDELRAAAEALRIDPSVRAVVLTAAGDAFCAGYDLDGVPAYGPGGPSGEWASLVEGANGALQAWLALPQPVIAAVRGAVADAGLSLILAADIRVAAYDATFEPGFARLGVPGADVGAARLLPGLVGRGIAADLMLTARPVDAREAMIIGLVSRVVAPECLLERALELAVAIAGYPTLGVTSVKRALRTAVPSPPALAAPAVPSLVAPVAPVSPAGSAGPVPASASAPASGEVGLDQAAPEPGPGAGRSTAAALRESWVGGAYASSKRALSRLPD